MSKDVAVTPSSGNVFADLGFEKPEEELLKAQLVREIRALLKRRRLTQAKASAWARAIRRVRDREWQGRALLARAPAALRAPARSGGRDRRSDEAKPRPARTRKAA